MSSQSCPRRSTTFGAGALRLVVWLFIIGATPASALAADWPAGRHDVQRSGVTDEKLSFPMRVAWEYRSAQPPAPAWGEQLDLINRVDFDYAPQPVIAGGILCFGSSADDTVRALDATTGVEKWRFTAGGPVRMGPQITKGKVYFGSDDGFIYCLDAATGKPVWSFTGAPFDERFVGNHRMMSRWPARCGAIVVGDLVYGVFGLWNTEGVFVYALDAKTGKTIWCNDGGGLGAVGMVDFVGMGVNGHHQGEFGFSGNNPQGPMAASAQALIIPNGFAGPRTLDLLTGRGISAQGGSPAGTGGTWLTVDGDRFYSFAMHGQGGMILAIAPYSFKANDVLRPWVADQVPQVSVGPRLKPGESHEKTKVSAIVNRGRLFARRAYGLALADTTLLLGQDGAIVAETTAQAKSAELRFGIAGDDLAVHAIINDRKVVQAEKPWKGSCIEIFGSRAEKAPIGQVCLIPATATQPAKALLSQEGKLIPAPQVRIQTTTITSGYELSALIPLSMLALTNEPLQFALEAQVTVTSTDGTLQRDTLFGSESAYQDNSRYGKFKVKPMAAIAGPEKVKAALALVKPSTIMMRGIAEIWRDSVDGEAREIAIADGRVYIGTSKGTIYCYESVGDEKGKGKAVVRDPAAEMRATAPPESTAKVIEQLRQTGADRGFALVLGDDDGKLSTALAAQTQLRIVNAVTDARAAGALRTKLIETTIWYGTRIHVSAVERFDRLPFAQFFANAVIVAGPAKQGAVLSGKELYRVLHPCGGVLLCPGLDARVVAGLIEDTGALPDEVRSNAGGLCVVRGKLPGALDWDAKVTADQRVKWPLRPLWFGGPSTLQIRNFNQGADGPTVANGRYFIKSEEALTGVDAYNGAILWSRPIPKVTPVIRSVDGALYGVSESARFEKGDFMRALRTNDDSVYLQLGKAYSRGKGDIVIALDARTGRQTAYHGQFAAPTVIALKSAQTWPIDIDEKHGGSVVMESSSSGLVLTLTTKDPAVTPLDAWDLFFDFRPAEARYGLYERGTFHIRVTPARDKANPATWAMETGDTCPMFDVTGTRETTGTKTIVALPWSVVQATFGGTPTDFGFAATLNSHDGGREEPIVRRHLFGDWCADGINNGWATIAFADPVAPATQPAIVVTGAPKKFGVASGVVNSGARSLADITGMGVRLHPLTGEPEPKVYRPATLCGASYFSATVMTGRASIYDFEDDSGLRFVGGVKSRCTSPQVIALGMVLISEETGHCSCNYPMRTSLALAPAERRLNEDWALFHDRDADTLVRHAALNLGAPGDRRDETGTLWLGFPRPPADKGLGYSLAAGKQNMAIAKGVWPRFMPPAMQVPLTIECFGGDDAYKPEQDIYTAHGWSSSWAANRKGNALGPNRVNGDRVVVKGTDHPWLYASNYRGIKKATLKLDLVPSLGSFSCDKPPTADGKLDDATWAGQPQGTLPFTATQIFLRHDEQNLYIAARRPAVIDRLGAVAPWAKTTKGEDAPVWNDDSFEIFITNAAVAAGKPDADAAIGRVLHLGVSASGARFDALGTDTGNNVEDPAWNGAWISGTSGDDKALSFEIVIPWKTLADAGLRREGLGINVQMNQKDVTGEENKYPGNAGRTYTPAGTTGEAICNLGPYGRQRCNNFAPLGLGAPGASPQRRFTVRLHFAEIDDVPAGQRVFDVQLQGKTVLKDLDVVKEAGPRTALVKEFAHVSATEELTIDFIPAAKDVEASNAPILSAIEVHDEGFQITHK